ncbi:SulP family inorganic anion transporter [Cyanobacterium stanieri LEGE 03274]|uniref:SulP family inorganic anion transporter n=1 Tax=Cyanobacterium stanieri LEGE 03274 TaxID=1828756 RepID=A0ABR9V0A7_9CHRO|nr:SulP family inorganic anion transporter [Cyanobacterium stanieri]MBE9221321.1 SulP family inorganic anion transporter [Cyanobacterium stanieri LEGE 03274]
MINTFTLQREWFSNVKEDLLAGAVVGLALIPEAIAFSIIAGVDPKVGLYASFIIAVTTAFLGGRPGSISAATGAMALLMIDLVKDYGIEYLFAATLLTGILQLIFGILKLGKQMKYVPRAVMMGYINALGVLIFLAQLPQLTNVPSAVYAITIGSLLIIYILPRFTQVVPSPLVALLVATVVTVVLNLDVNLGVPTVGDMGELPATLPFFRLPDVPFNLKTLQIILPFSLTMALVGLLASFLTAALVDELTDTPSNKNQEAKGQGIANIITSFFGGMAGCGMIGQSVINVQSGGRGRLSTFSAGMFLLFAILVLQQWVQRMPMGALVAVMIMVSVGTIRWSSFKNIKRTPPNETIVMLSTMIVTVVTSNFALGVITGIILRTIFFSRQIAELVFVEKVLDEENSLCTYNVSGQIFFVSIEEFYSKFDFDDLVDRVVINLTHAHLWDQGAIAALDKVMIKFRRNGADVELIGLNEASATLLENLGTFKEAKLT